MNWISFTNLSQISEISESSHKKPVIIFKHSTRCSVSRLALKQFEREFDIDASQIDCYFLDLLNFKEISNQIGEHFAVQHQSPQLILVQNGQATYNVSHSEIDASDLKKFLKM